MEALLSDAEFKRRADRPVSITTDWIAVAEAERAARIEAEAALADVSAALGPGVRFMDPPDGGDPTIAEQVGNAVRQLGEAEAALAEARLKTAPAAIYAVLQRHATGSREEGTLSIDSARFAKLARDIAALSRATEREAGPS